MSRSDLPTLSESTLASLAALDRAARQSPAASSHYPRSGTTFRPKVGTEFPSTDQAVETDRTGSVPTFPCSHSEVCLNAWEERAAILEFDGGLPRPTAERVALSLLLLEEMDSSSTQVGNLERELTALDRLRL